MKIYEQMFAGVFFTFIIEVNGENVAVSFLDYDNLKGFCAFRIKTYFNFIIQAEKLNKEETKVIKDQFHENYVRGFDGFYEFFQELQDKPARVIEGNIPDMKKSDAVLGEFLKEYNIALSNIKAIAPKGYKQNTCIGIYKYNNTLQYRNWNVEFRNELHWHNTHCSELVIKLSAI